MQLVDRSLLTSLRKVHSRGRQIKDLQLLISLLCEEVRAGRSQCARDVTDDARVQCYALVRQRPRRIEHDRLVPWSRPRQLRARRVPLPVLPGEGNAGCAGAVPTPASAALCLSFADSDRSTLLGPARDAATMRLQSNPPGVRQFLFLILIT